MPSLEELASVHTAIVEGSFREGANKLLQILGEDAQVGDESHGLKLLQQYCLALLEADNYEAAATLQWGRDMLDMRPKAAADVFAFIPNHYKILFQGACSLGKTYTAVAYVLLDYLREPQYTAVKMIAVNEDHLKANMFAHMLALYRALAIPMLDPKDVVIREANNYLGLRSAGNDMGIDGVAFRQSKFGSGTIRGYKPKPYRDKPHPIWGRMTRLRILGDEGQHWPDGQFEDLNSPLASATESGLVKVMIAYNPIDISKKIVQLAEPEQGWLDSDLDKLYRWRSKQHWDVLRLDGAQCENVIQRKIVYPGFITYEAYLGTMAGGDDAAAYYVNSRGFPPVRTSHFTIIPGNWANRCWGEATFIGEVKYLGTADLAYEGTDKGIFAVFRWGLASGWRKRDGSYEVFPDRLHPGLDKPRLVLQLDQLLDIQKSEDTIIVANDIRDKAKTLGIKPEHMAVDRTGKGDGTYFHLLNYWGRVLGIQWGEGATAQKILAGFNEGADKTCAGVVTEMWWTIRHWMDPSVGAIIINPAVNASTLMTQLTYRRYFPLTKSRVRVESKEEYKARQKTGCDEGDALVMGPFLVRHRLNEFPGVQDQRNNRESELGVSVSHEDVDDDPPRLDYGATAPFSDSLR